MAMTQDQPEITPENIYISRRKFLAGITALASVSALAACGGPSAGDNADFCDGASAMKETDELGYKLTTCENITSYNNYYEFSYSKTGIAALARDFHTSPWTVSVGGLVDHPRTWTMEEILQHFPSREHVYRMRCVEGWAMVIPWLGFPLADLLNEAGPQPAAGFVRFESVFDPAHMPGQAAGNLNFPYVEGLRLDEAVHPLTILATGLYGKPLPVQDGAPVRLVVPWKYAFKYIKAIVKIDLVEKMPVSTWMTASPSEYGFYANVNPEVDHPRWSQANERYIGENGRRPTRLFNGYQDVAPLYEGMDLKKNF
jgi:methionine sulfoxide reductase catalytic subunit